MAFDSYAAIEARISEAFDATDDGWYTNCVQAAGAFFAGYTDGGMERVKKYTSNKALTEEQEGSIREYIDSLDKINMCARPQMIVGAADYLIRFENRMVGHQ